MTGATHMLAAAAIYKFVPLEKPVVLAIALASHFVLDAIPHYELTKTVLVVDFTHKNDGLLRTVCKMEVFGIRSPVPALFP